MLREHNYDVWETKRHLSYSARTHPRAQLVDFIKRLHQSEFGSDYPKTSPEKALQLLRDELENMTEEMKHHPWFDPFGSNFCRMYLSVSSVLSPELIQKITDVSDGQISAMAWFRFEEKLRLLQELCREEPELFTFTSDELARYLEQYRKDGYPPVRHSEIYEKTYEPAYRVIRKEYSAYITLFAAMEKHLRTHDTLTVAIDGNVGAGKAEAADLIASLFDCNVFHTEDFFLAPEKRAADRSGPVDGELDLARFREEICENIRAGRAFAYHPLNHSVMKLAEPVSVEPKKINVIEGSYCMHPELREYYDLKVFISIPPKEQEARLLERHGNFLLRRFLEDWIPGENRFFDEFKVRQACDLLF